MGKRTGSASDAKDGGKRSKARSLTQSPAKGQPSGRQSTIGAAFAAAANSKGSGVHLEVNEPMGTLINDYDSQNMKNTISHHLIELDAKRRSLQAVSLNNASQERSGRSRRSKEEDEGLPPAFRDDAREPDRSVGDEDAYRYMCQLQELTDETVTPTREQIQNVITIMRAHDLHGRRDLSSMAFNLLQKVARLHPSISVRRHDAGACQDGVARPFVLVNRRAWRLTDCCEALGAQPEQGEGAQKYVSAFEILSQLVAHCHASIMPEAEARPSQRLPQPALAAGEVLLLKWILSEMQLDLCCRLAVYFEAEGQSVKSARLSLLQNSQLWRTFSDSASRVTDGERRDFVIHLMQLIAAPANEAVAPPSSDDPRHLEQSAFGASHASDLAANLLSMLLELYSTAEDAGMFLRHGGNRTTTSGALPNVRMLLEVAMVGGLVGSNQALSSLPQKQAFLQALHPRERLRLLTMIVSKGHARRKTDGATYPSLERFNFLFTNHGDVDAYLNPHPTEALQYILDDLPTGLSYNLLDRSADGLALLAAQLAQAAAEQPAGAGEVAGIFARLVDSLVKQSNACQASKALSPPALLSLHAAQHALAAAC